MEAIGSREEVPLNTEEARHSHRTGQNQRWATKGQPNREAEQKAGRNSLVAQRRQILETLRMRRQRRPRSRREDRRLDRREEEVLRRIAEGPRS